MSSCNLVLQLTIIITINRITDLIEHQYANTMEHLWHFAPSQSSVAVLPAFSNSFPAQIVEIRAI